MSAAELKDKIKELRKKSGLTMRQLADAVNVSEATISRWESGNIPNMRRDKIYDLAKALNTTPAYLMGWDEHSDTVQQTYKTNSDNESEELIILNRAVKKMTPEKQKKLLEMAKLMFAEDFDDDKKLP